MNSESKKLIGRSEIIDISEDRESKRLIRKPKVLDVSGIESNSTLYHLMKHGDFPRPVRLGKRAVAWREREVLKWIESRERALDTGITDEI